MRVYYDTEFWERGPDHPIELISIGMVAEDGRELYLISSDAPYDDIAAQHGWLRLNVLNHLPMRVYKRHDLWWHHAWLTDHPDASRVMTRDAIRDEVRAFLAATPDLELWGWYSSYDHLMLAQLFGRMIDLPDFVPMWTNDLRQEVHRLGNPPLPEQEDGLHNALADARHLKRCAEHLAAVAQ